MNEIYWITRFDDICLLLKVFGIMSSVCLAACLLGIVIWDYDEENIRKKFVKATKWLIPTVGIIWSAFVFVPNTKDALMIYGIGGTIDYIKSNEKAKQLPDKVVDALDKYLDSINEPKKE